MRIINLILNKYTKPFLTNFYGREKGVIGRQRVTVFVYSSILLITGVLLNLCEMAGPVSTFFKIANTTQGVLTLLWLTLYYHRLISLTTALSLFCFVLQVEISAESIYCALQKSDYDIALIIANMALSAIVLLLSIITYLRIVPSGVAALSLGTFALSIYLTGSDVLLDFFMVFFIVFIVLTLLGSSLIRNIALLDKENTELKDERQEMLDVFRLTSKEMRSYVVLAREQRLAPQVTAQILTAIGDAAEKRILDNVAHYLRQSTIEFEKLSERLPELTPSELEISALILKEKKLKEIIELLGKSRSNITCQRSNIRTKLGLQPGDNLLEALKKRMEN